MPSPNPDKEKPKHKTTNDNRYEQYKNKFFISVPITGHEEEARELVSMTTTLLRETCPNIQFYTPFEICQEVDKPYSYYMGFASDESKGCRCEAATADIYGIKRIPWVKVKNSVKACLELVLNDK